MRKFLISVAAAVSTVAVAAPASAQWSQQRLMPTASTTRTSSLMAIAYGYRAQAQAIQIADRPASEREIQRLAQYRMISRASIAT